MNEPIDGLKGEFRKAIEAERHAEAGRFSESLLEILTESYRSDRAEWEKALELWHWARRTARVQQSHLAQERGTEEHRAAYGGRRLRTTCTFFLDG